MFIPYTAARLYSLSPITFHDLKGSVYTALQQETPIFSDSNLIIFK